MKNIRLDIKINALDGYLYNGELFIITKNGTLSTITFEKLIKNIIQSTPEYESILTLAFLRNDWIHNPQGINYQKLNNVKLNFKNQWEKASNKKIEIEISGNSLLEHYECPSMPIFDVKAYGMRLYLGHRNGLHESLMSFDPKKSNKLNLHKSSKVFDARSSFITAKSGEILVSSNTDGLFAGSLWNTTNSNIQISDKKIAEKSLRTGWAGYNIVNYEEQTKFLYLKNNTEKVEEKRGFSFSMIDDSSEKVRITEYGEEKYTLDDLLSNKKFSDEEIQYSFNNSSSIYFMLSNNKLINIYLNENRFNNTIYLSQREHLLPFKTKKKLSRPMSSAFIPNGCILEFFDSVFLIHKNKTQLIMDEPVFSIRTFPNSKRFKNLILLFSENGLSIQSIYPLEV